MAEAKSYLNMTPSQFVENFIRISGREFKGECGFEYWPYLKRVYDTPHRMIILHSSRQSSKSTTIGNLLLTYAVIEAPLSALYVGRSDKQVAQFSRDRLKVTMSTSPLLATLTSDSNLSQNVSEKEFSNGSIVRLRSAGAHPDTVRGIAARFLAVDEAQEIQTNFLPVIFECTATYPKDKIIFIAGTPLSQDNTLSRYYYQYSTMNEWMIKCEGCNRWNILGVENIGESGIICARCGRPLDYRKGIWIAGRTDAEFEGFRFSQLITPYSYYDWEKSVLLKYKTYPINQFFNEVLGLPYEQGIKPITYDQIVACCQNYDIITEPNNALKVTQSFAGIDWGTGESSYTVLSIGAMLGNKVKVYFIKKYRGVEAVPDRCLDDICKMIKKYQVNTVAADWGGGMKYNFDLYSRLSPQHTVVQVQESGTLKEKLKFDRRSGYYVVNRTMFLSDVFWMIKKKMIIFPKKDFFMPDFAQDILSVYQEETARGIRYDHPPGETDDTLHSLAFMLIAAQLTVGLSYLYSPREAAKIHLPE